MSTAGDLPLLPRVEWHEATQSERIDLQRYFSRRSRHCGQLPNRVMVMREGSQIIRSAIQYIDDGFNVRWGIQNHPSNEIKETWSTILSWLRPLTGDVDVVEVYPCGARIINTAPIRWFWILPEGLPTTLDLSKTAGGE